MECKIREVKNLSSFNCNYLFNLEDAWIPTCLKNVKGIALRPPIFTFRGFSFPLPPLNFAFFKVQVLHGCRQPVPWEVRLTPLTGEIPIVNLYLTIWCFFLSKIKCRLGLRQALMALMNWAIDVPQELIQIDARPKKKIKSLHHFFPLRF